MATITREALNAQGMFLKIYTGGMSRVGFSLTGTWVGTASFYQSWDGVNFLGGSMGGPLAATPFPSGAAVQAATANGSFFADVNNALAFGVLLSSYTSGALNLAIAAAVDASWQDAYLAATSHFAEQDAGANAQNQITIAAQLNRAWRTRKVSGGFTAAPAAGVKVTIGDGPSAILWAEYVNTAQWTLNLPEDPRIAGVSGGGVVGTIGNPVLVTVAAPGSGVSSSLSVELIPA